jgi:hypothetical protein
MRMSAVDVDAAAAALRRHGRQVEIVESAIATPLDFLADVALSWLGG